jgi:hypothetical protein
MNESTRNALSRVYDRALFLHGSKRNEVLSLAEIEQYGLDSSADAYYVSLTECRLGNGTAMASRMAKKLVPDAALSKNSLLSAR